MGVRAGDIAGTGEAVAVNVGEGVSVGIPEMELQPTTVTFISKKRESVRKNDLGAVMVVFIVYPLYFIFWLAV